MEKLKENVRNYQLNASTKTTQYLSDGYSQYQNYLYKRALYGLDSLDEKELVKSCLTLVFDGFMIPKDNVKNVNMDELLKELEQEVLNELGYNIKLVVKPMNNIINIPDDYKEESNEGLNIIKNDDEGANYVLTLLNDCICGCEKTMRG